CPLAARPRERRGLFHQPGFGLIARRELAHQDAIDRWFILSGLCEAYSPPTLPGQPRMHV
ncbi:MAG: hypothetical protein KGM43_07005, partial [Planctomycetota bacterium]|nr:hypothetical protein [Planctomycetota bacterium]